MLGRESPQGGLFAADHQYIEHVGRDSFYGFLALHRHEMFEDDAFVDLYGAQRGRPSVPPSRLCVALLLQARDGVSDDEAIQRSAFDIRWKVALGLELDEKLCAKSTLQLFRGKLVLHERFQAIFHASVEACRQKGLLKKKRKLEVAIDTAPVFGRGAVKDAFNLVSDQIRRILREAAKLKGWDPVERAEREGLGAHFEPSFKGTLDIDWSNAEAKRGVVAQLAEDARAALRLAREARRGHARGAEKIQHLREAEALLADLLLQNIDDDPEDGGGPDISRETKDRIISTTDPEMRRGYKSRSKSFDGYKAAVATDTISGVVLSTDVLVGNQHDSTRALALVTGAAESVGRAVARVLGDTAYGGTSLRNELEASGIELVAKTQAPPGTKKGVSADDFRVGPERAFLVCPEGKRSKKKAPPNESQRRTYRFLAEDCDACRRKSDCTLSAGPRTVTITADSLRLRAQRRRQNTSAFRRVYRRRVAVEHSLARIMQRGMRQARYLGRAKTHFQLAISAAVANLTRALAV